MRRITAKVTRSRWGQVGSAIHAALVETVASTAGEVKDDAQARAKVRTGSMRDSVYVLTKAEDGYDGAVAAADADNPRVAVFDRLEAPESDTAALVPVAVAHAETQENGLHPFLTPAADDNCPVFEYDVKQAIRAAVKRSTL